MRALAATGKFDNEEDGPDCGLTDCVVNIESDSDPLASIDASVSAGLSSEGGQQLPQCLRDFLRAFFPEVQVGNWTMLSPVDAARFISTPDMGKLGVSAMTRGLYDINYDPKYFDLTGGEDKSSIESVAEEIAHAVQFISVWDKVEIQTGVSGSYSRALTSWGLTYLTESGRIVARNLSKATVYGLGGPPRRLEDPYYENKYEREAKEKARVVYDAARSLPNSPCYP